MEQDNERDYLGRQYGPQSSGTTAPKVPPASAAEPDPTSAEPHRQTHGTPAPPTSAADAPAGVPARRLQVGTVVWGLVLTVLAVLVLLINTVNLSVDPTVLALCLALGAGLALLVGGFLSGLQRNRSR